jgi:hypothetical protein
MPVAASLIDVFDMPQETQYITSTTNQSNDDRGGDIDSLSDDDIS